VMMALPVDVAGLRPRLGDVEAPPKPRSSLSSMAEAESEPLGPGHARRRRRSGTRRVPRPWRGQGTGHGTSELHQRCHVRLAATARASHCNIVVRPGQAATGGQAPTARRRAPSVLRDSGSGRQTPATVATRGRRRDPAEAAAATRVATTTQAGVPQHGLP
jgi:hypothetical protein